jgi:molecular chaperone DnaK (HSP70)
VATRGFRLSVDFGTSHTAAVLTWPDGPVRPLLFDGSPLLPSTVYADPAAGLIAGRDAVLAARVGPDRFEPPPKQRIDDGTVLLGGVGVPVPELIAAVLRRVALEAALVAGGPLLQTVLTYPAGWGPRRRQILRAAAATVFAEPHLVPEPVAAASWFVRAGGGRIPVGGHALMYDLGAGTFDAALVRRIAGGFDVLAEQGLTDAGGLDVDAAIVAHLAGVYAARDPGRWDRLANPATAEDQRLRRTLWDDVRAAKEMLSRAPSTVLHVPLFDDQVPLGRELLDELARPILQRTVETTRACLAAAGTGATDLAGLFLVGGSSRLPLAATLLHRAFGIAPAVTDQPELVVAEGALYTTDAAADPTREAAAPLPPPVPLPPARRRTRRTAVLATGLSPRRWSAARRSRWRSTSTATPGPRRVTTRRPHRPRRPARSRRRSA